MTTVQSTDLAAVDFDDLSGTLTIEFHSGGVYEYSSWNRSPRARAVFCLGWRRACWNEGMAFIRVNPAKNMFHNGKIGRLPKDVQEQLNRRLDNGERGGPLVA
jgi:hypothetical protein